MPEGARGTKQRREIQVQGTHEKSDQRWLHAKKGKTDLKGAKGGDEQKSQTTQHVLVIERRGESEQETGGGGGGPIGLSSE